MLDLLKLIEPKEKPVSVGISIPATNENHAKLREFIEKEYPLDFMQYFTVWATGGVKEHHINGKTLDKLCPVSAMMKNPKNPRVYCLPKHIYPKFESFLKA